MLGHKLSSPSSLAYKAFPLTGSAENLPLRELSWAPSPADDAPSLVYQGTREGAHDSLQEVLNMKTAQNVDCEVDSWIADEELPLAAQLKVIRQNDPDYGLTEDALDERIEFIQWYLLQDSAPLLSVLGQTADACFFIPEADVMSPEYSAFNTHDFLDSLQPFNKYGYAMKKNMERIRDLGILHSSLSCAEGRGNTQRKFEAFLEAKFRSRLAHLIERCQSTANSDRKLDLKQKIAELTRRILEAKRIGERYALWDSRVVQNRLSPCPRCLKTQRVYKCFAFGGD